MPDAVTDRIEKALTRIEAAAAARAYGSDRIARRHAALRDQVEAAVASLDALIGRDDRRRDDD